MSIISEIASCLTGIDYDLLRFLHDHPIPGSVPALQFISASTTYLSITVTLVVLAFALFRRSAELRKKFYTLALVLILVGLISQGLKALIIRERPFKTFTEIEKLSDAGGSSFPSGHTMEAFAVATALMALLKRRRITITAFFWASAVAYSRMALGVHYPGDVLGGLITGCFIGWLVPWIFSRSSGN